MDKPELPSGDSLRPTTIGHGENGQFLFWGTLGRPIILKERFLPDEESDLEVDSDILIIADELCA
ncbi:MAG: hypothetical protein ACI9NT_000101 [Bacteroidia bacterium]|jgi:hypothetical protein